MIGIKIENQNDRIEQVLEKIAEKMERRGSGDWIFELRNGTVLKTSARIENGWLITDASFGKGHLHPLETQDNTWEYLKLNGNLAGGAKIVLPPKSRCLHLRGEIPLDEEFNFERRIQCLFEEFTMASDKLENKKVEYSPGTQLTFGPRENAPGLSRLCIDAGWPFHERSEGKLAVDLEVARSFYQAIVEEEANSVLRVYVELAICESLPDVCRRALGELLLRAGHWVRLARPVVREESGKTTIRFEVLFEPAPCPEELDQGLSALSVACRFCGKETQALMNEEIAEEYLAVTGCPRNPR
jgi:hypothetical protein